MVRAQNLIVPLAVFFMVSSVLLWSRFAELSIVAESHEPNQPLHGMLRQKAARLDGPGTDIVGARKATDPLSPSVPPTVAANRRENQQDVSGIADNTQPAAVDHRRENQQEASGVLIQTLAEVEAENVEKRKAVAKKGKWEAIKKGLEKEKRKAQSEVEHRAKITADSVGNWQLQMKREDRANKWQKIQSSLELETRNANEHEDAKAKRQKVLSLQAKLLNQKMQISGHWPVAKLLSDEVSESEIHGLGVVSGNLSALFHLPRCHDQTNAAVHAKQAWCILKYVAYAEAYVAQINAETDAAQEQLQTLDNEIDNDIHRCCATKDSEQCLYAFRYGISPVPKECIHKGCWR